MNSDFTVCDGDNCPLKDRCKRYRIVQEEDFAKYYGFFCLAHDEGIEKCELYCKD